MSAVGVRELKAKTSEVIRRVHEEGETFDVILRGRVVARISPVEPPRMEDEETAAFWADIKQLSEEISAVWPKGVSAVDAVREQRRELQ